MVSTLISKSSSDRGVTMQVILPETIAQGESAEALILLRNQSTKEVHRDGFHGYRDCNICLLDSTGQPCQYTEYGKTVMWAVGDQQQHDSRHLSPVRPTESHVWGIDLHKCFLLKPGKYKLSASVMVSIASDLSDNFAIGIEDFEMTVAQ